MSANDHESAGTDEVNRNYYILLGAWLACWSIASGAIAAEPGLVGHWKLQGDCRDYSGNNNHAVNHGVDLGSTASGGAPLDGGAFDGRSAYLEVPSSDSLKLGAGDFTISAQIFTAKELDDIGGDVIDMYDPATRRGITLCINSSAGGYQSQGTDRHIHFGIDNARMSDWQDCGKPDRASDLVSNSMTVYKGKLYAATTDGPDQNQWCRVYRYDGEQNWIDCGRVGDRKTPGVGPMIVHNGDLYVVTWTYDWRRVEAGDYDSGRVYRYLGGKDWEDCGQPSDNRTLNCIASFKGKLYVGGGPKSLGVFTQSDNGEWQPSKVFPKEGARRCYPHAMCRHNGKLFVAYPGAYAFDGKEWTYAGDPVSHWFLQTHSLGLYQGKLCAGTWPDAKVATYQGGENWQEIGRVGDDGTEVNSMVVYNGKLYGGSLPRAELCRYDGDSRWTTIRRFHAPEGWQPAVPGKISRDQVDEMCRLTSLTVFDGKLFASTGMEGINHRNMPTPYGNDAPADARGRVFSIEAGKVATYDDDLGPGWKHLVAVREGGQLKLYVNGKQVAASATFDSADYDLSTDRPLRIGMGQTEFFDGKLRDLRLYNRALKADEVLAQHERSPQR